MDRMDKGEYIHVHVYTIPFSTNLKIQIFRGFRYSFLSMVPYHLFTVDKVLYVARWLVLTSLLDTFERFMQEHAWLDMRLLCCIIPELEHKN